MNRQSFGPPSTRAEERGWRAAGLLVDVAGRVLPATAPLCGFCDGEDIGDTCPASLTCPTCKATPRQRCRRPSGHTAEQWHCSRVRAADLEDQRREEDGDTTLPARWADTPPAPTPSRGKR
ncbi:zinc finger domain-containing protein [Streptomyces lavendulocolor]